jgi:hypothetical protein
VRVYPLILGPSSLILQWQTNHRSRDFWTVFQRLVALPHGDRRRHDGVMTVHASPSSNSPESLLRESLLRESLLDDDTLGVRVDVSTAKRSAVSSRHPSVEVNHDPLIVKMLIILGVLVSFNALLGPLVGDVITYHFSKSLINQTIGLDAVSLFVVAPLCLFMAWALHTGRSSISRVGLRTFAMSAPLFVAYMMPQYVVGPDYLGLPGNNQRFFLLHLSIFIVSVVATYLLADTVRSSLLPPLSRRSRRLIAGVLLAASVFVTFFLHGPGIVDSFRSKPTNTAFLDSPTAFWTVKLMDLGIIVPMALGGAVAVLRRVRRAQNLAYPLVGWLCLDGLAVTAMAIVMEYNDDPTASMSLTVGFGVLSILFVGVVFHLLRPLRK